MIIDSPHGTSLHWSSPVTTDDASNFDASQDNTNTGAADLPQHMTSDATVLSDSHSNHHK